MPEYISETQKYRSLTVPYCQGCGIDIASQGDPVVPWAWQLDLPEAEYAYYNSNHPSRGPIQLRGHGDHLPVETASLDFVYSSHLIEDYLEDDWNKLLVEWSRPIKPGGWLIILTPDKALWAQALAKGQPPNCSHKFEPCLGDMTRHANSIGGLVVEFERLTNLFEGDYSILFVAKKT